ncbi:acetyltransferase, partial [Listeria seeligeri FSL S4-171]
KSKFTKTLFSKVEVPEVVSAFCHFLYTEKGENLLIAMCDDKICGCLFLTSNSDSYGNLVSSLRTRLSLPQTLKLLFLLGLLSHTPKPQERYIDFIAVSPHFRGRGIGKKLIFQCKKLFPNERVNLYVAKNNGNAYQLYKKLGFQVIKKNNSALAGMLTGIKEWYMMEWVE